MKIKKTNILFSFFCLTFFLFVILFTSCTQEHLIFIRNINKASIISLDQILKESGLKGKRESSNRRVAQKETEVKKEVVYEEAAPKKIKEVNKQLNIAKGVDFSINLPAGSGYTALKSVQGDLKYLKEQSSQDKGYFYFHSGNKDSKVHLQIFDEAGELLKNCYYFIRVQGSDLAAQVAVKTDEMKSPVRLNNTAAVSSLPQRQQQAQQTSSLESSEGTNAGTTGDLGFSPLVLSSIEGLSPTEAARELKRMLASDSLSESDKDPVRYKLAEILISQRSYTEAQNTVNQMQNDAAKAFYSGKLQRGKHNYQGAMKLYLSSLKGDEALQKKGVNELETLALDMGTVEKSLLDNLMAVTKKYKNDKDFYGNSIISIARIYQYIPDVYTAKELLESIQGGDFSDSIKAKASQYYDELKKDFLEYK